VPWHAAAAEDCHVPMNVVQERYERMVALHEEIPRWENKK
jgi:hypothetical protein